MWSKPLLCRFRQSGKVQQTQVLQGFAVFCHDLTRIPPRHTQIKRATNCAIPGYLILDHYSTKFVRLKDFPVCGHSCGQSCFCAVFSNREKPAIACVTRLCGVSPHPIPDTTTALPKQARYQLRYTRIWNDLMGMDPPEATRRCALHTIPVHYNTPAAKREAYSYPFFFAGKTLAWYY